MSWLRLGLLALKNKDFLIYLFLHLFTFIVICKVFWYLCLFHHILMWVLSSSAGHPYLLMLSGRQGNYLNHLFFFLFFFLGVCIQSQTTRDRLCISLSIIYCKSAIADLGYSLILSEIRIYTNRNNINGSRLPRKMFTHNS